MRTLLALVLLIIGVPALADDYQLLYQAAGWAEQRAHFNDALHVAQKRYQANLPAVIYDSLVETSNQRFAAADMDARALASLRAKLPNSQAALAFFESPLGRKISQAEIQATAPEQLERNARGLPRQPANQTRRQAIRRLQAALPAREAGAEVGVALAAVAADSLSQMLPGLAGQGQGALESQRQRIMKQIDGDLENTLLYVYRDLTDAELGHFANFAESPDGRHYYQAALIALRAALNAPQ